MLGVAINYSGHVGISARLAGATFMLKLHVLWCTLYNRDQNLIITAMTAQLSTTTLAGYLVERNLRKAASLVVISLAFIYFFLLYARRLRPLPRGLEGARFVRLSYLRHLRDTGQR